ncbi:MAG: GNAT family N-acetyltransferase [Alphaproteobacteria bacterium]|jgi:GNAT superfamily N-acetyltransferase|nr:GNAT family N-acetyltransferase [Alphaproteobacteria bacterium]
MNNLDIRIIESDHFPHSVGELSEMLHACVHAGASINFILPFTRFESEQYWNTTILPGVLNGTRMVWVARLDNRLAGTVQLDCDTPPNQPHRAEVAKMMVHPDFRRQGIAKCLMIELEAHAKTLGKTLITLDTRTGDNAEPLYAELGYVTAGTIPGYCRDPFVERLDATTIMYKAL